jgi:hypothetical protein
MPTPSLRQAALAAAFLGAACSAELTLPPASDENVVDTVTLYALSGTPIGTYSAYQMDLKRVVRTDQTSAFDFVFDIDTAGPALHPSGLYGLAEGAGFQDGGAPFDSLTFAPLDGYEYQAATPIDSGDVLYVRSRPVTCLFGTFAYFGKLEVLAVDTVARRIDLQVLVNANCGYRSLEPGIPRR